jgi:hypothetical protein
MSKIEKGKSYKIINSSNYFKKKYGTANPIMKNIKKPKP